MAARLAPAAAEVTARLLPRMPLETGVAVAVAVAVEAAAGIAVAVGVETGAVTEVSVEVFIVVVIFTTSGSGREFFPLSPPPFRPLHSGIL